MNPVTQRFLDANLIDKTAAASLEEFSDMIKESGFLDQVGKGLLSALKITAPVMVGSAIGNFGADYLSKRDYEKEKENETRVLNKSFQNLSTLKDFEALGDKAQERFYEIGQFSPTIASMPSVVLPLIKRTLDTGLNEVDIKNLTQIESSRRTGPRKESPLSKTFRETVPRTVAGITENVIKGYEDYTSLGAMPTTMEGYKAVLQLLYENGFFPSSVGEAPIGPERAKILNDYMTTHAGDVKPFLASKGLSSAVNEITTKLGSVRIVDTLSLEKKAEIMADQYVFLKHAKIDLSKALMGLGLAAVFGGTTALVEEGADYARSLKLKNSLKASWAETQKRLKGLTEDESSLSKGVDYTDKKYIGQAQEAFQMLSDIAPNLAANPAIATPFVNRAIQQEGDISPDTFKVLSDIQKNISGNKQYRSPFLDSSLGAGFERGFGMAGGQELIKGVAKGMTSD